MCLKGRCSTPAGMDCKSGILDISGISASLNMDPHAYIEGDRILGTLEYLKDGDAVKARIEEIEITVANVPEPGVMDKSPAKPTDQVDSGHVRASRPAEPGSPASDQVKPPQVVVITVKTDAGIEGYGFGGAFSPTDQTGGDLYDFVPLDDHRLFLLMGDATGHGLRAGNIVTATKSLLNHLACQDDLSRIMAEASDALRGMGFGFAPIGAPLASSQAGSTQRVTARQSSWAAGKGCSGASR